jgi:hypothetical protein
MKSVKTHIYLMLFIYLFSTRNLFNDVFNSLECAAFDVSMISE